MIVDRADDFYTTADMLAGLGGLGSLGNGSVANYSSGDSGNPTAGYCAFVLAQGDKFASAYGKRGCRDFNICKDGGIPPMDGVELCASTIGGGTCCDANGKNCYVVGEGCDQINTIVTSWSGKPSSPTFQSEATPELLAAQKVALSQFASQNNTINDVANGTSPFTSNFLSNIAIPSILTEKHFGLPTWVLIGGGVIGLPILMSLVSGGRRG